MIAKKFLDTIYNERNDAMIDIRGIESVTTEETPQLVEARKRLKSIELLINEYLYCHT